MDMEWMKGVPFVGAGLSMWGAAEQQAEANERAREARKKLKERAEQAEKEWKAVEGKWDPYTEGLGNDYADYQAALQGYRDNAGKFAPTQEWNYDLKKGIADVWDPFFNEKVDLAAKQVYGGAANAGKLMSSATARNVANAVGKQYDQSYQAALNAAQEQERQQYGWYSDQVARERAAVEQANQLLMNNIGNYGESVNKGFNALGQQNALSGQRISDVNNLNIAAINAGLGQASPLGAGLSAGGQALSGTANSYYSAQNKG